MQIGGVHPLVVVKHSHKQIAAAVNHVENESALGPGHPSGAERIVNHICAAKHIFVYQGYESVRLVSNEASDVPE
jgi:hypothetical protein